MGRDFEQIKFNIDLQKTKDHLQDLRDIGNNKPKHKACNCVSGEDCHRNYETDVCNHKKNARCDGKSIVTGVKDCPHAKSVVCIHPITMPLISITNKYAADIVKAMER